jgi:hypothetical protein
MASLGTLMGLAMKLPIKEVQEYVANHAQQLAIFEPQHMHKHAKEIAVDQGVLQLSDHYIRSMAQLMSQAEGR